MNTAILIILIVMFFTLIWIASVLSEQIKQLNKNQKVIGEMIANMTKIKRNEK